jgi:hypothetical protein
MPPVTGVRRTLLLLLGFLATGHEALWAKGSKLFLAEDSQHQRWCAYVEESAWKSAVRSLSSLRVATAEFANDHLTALNFSQEDEAGDWAVFDRYSLGADGRPNRLERTINILPGNRRIKRVYLIEEGASRVLSTVTLELSTGKSAPPFEGWIPDLSVITDCRSFPFFDLLNRKRPEASRTGKVCTHAEP